MAEGYLGEIRLFAGEAVPQGWLACDGSNLPVQQNQALFSLLGNRFGGNGTTNFNLPDLRGRVMVGQGASKTGTSYIVGQSGGMETVTLTAEQMPPHTHTLITDATDAVSVAPGNNYFSQAGHSVSGVFTPVPLYARGTGAPAVPLAAGAVTAAGGSQPHSNMQPYLAMTYCICNSGLYPDRP